MDEPKAEGCVCVLVRFRGLPLDNEEGRTLPWTNKRVRLGFHVEVVPILGLWTKSPSNSHSATMAHLPVAGHHLTTKRPIICHEIAEALSQQPIRPIGNLAALLVACRLLR